MSQRKQQSDVTAIVLAAVAGDASVEDLQRLERLLSEDPSLTPLVVDLMNQESWLTWHSARASEGEVRADILLEIAKTAGLPLQDSSEPRRSRTLGQRLEATSPPRVKLGLPRMRIDWSNALAAFLLVVIGAVAGVAISRYGEKSPVDKDKVALSERGSVETTNHLAVRYVRGTACLWNPGLMGGDPEPRGEVQAGDSLNLLQGIAELDFELPTGSVALKIEGPSGLVITQGHSATLSSGVFTVETEASVEQFRLQTANGLIEFAGGASAGIRITGGEVELHVFQGRAQLSVPWSSGAGDAQLLDVAAGSSVTLSSTNDGRVRIDRGAASESSFAAKRSMDADDLSLPKNYAQIVAEANPLLYWRFEEGTADRVRDYSGNKLHGKVIGEANWAQSQGNTSLSLGDAVSGDALGSYVKSDVPISDHLVEGYTVEFWFKSSHYHWGNVFSLLDCQPSSASYMGHGVALELGGARSSISDLERPGTIRYLHRNPPSADFRVGTSVFSPSHYKLRQWQHLAAVKSDSKMELYIDGKSLATAVEPSPLGPGLSILLGQLDEQQIYRRFVGQIDELAVYARQLDANEIVRHYEVVRPRIKTDDQQSTSGGDQATQSLPAI